MVLGAGGAFGPDLMNALRLRGTGAVVGVDVQLTYPVAGTGYRYVDLTDAVAVSRFYDALRRFARGRGLALGTTYDLSTVQTSPRTGGGHPALTASKDALVDALRQAQGDAQLFYMSTAEVYGAPPGAPYREECTKAPVNPYGRAKWACEQRVIAAHGQPTLGGTLRCTALRSWTICMVNVDAQGRIQEARNYNDPMLVVADQLARAAVPLPLVDESLRAQFHFSEEVAEVAVLLGSRAADAPTWGHAFNCPGRAATHGQIRDIAFEVFTEGQQHTPWWALPVRLALGGRRLPAGIMAGLAQVLERSGGLLGARDVAGRLPFLYRSTDMDAGALRQLLGAELTEPEGSPTKEAVRRLAIGMRDGGEQALSRRRYRSY